MKVTCEIVKDLMILKETDRVSEDSSVAIEEHLNSCEACRIYQKELKDAQHIFDEMKVDSIDTAALDDKKIMKKGLGKIRRRWIISLVLVVLLAGVVPIGYRLTRNQIKGYGLNYTNLGDVYMCNRFFDLLKEKKYAKAAQLLDYSDTFEEVRSAYSEALEQEDSYEISWLEEMYGNEILDWTMKDFNSYMKAQTAEELEEFFNQGYAIDEVIFDDQYQSEVNNTGYFYQVKMTNPAGDITDYEFFFDIVNGELVILDICASGIMDEGSLLIFEILE